MKKLLVVIVVAIVLVLVLRPDLRDRILHLGMKTAVDMEITNDPNAPSDSSEQGYVKVYIWRSNETYYHRRDCPDLPEDEVPVAINLEKARELRAPCPVCDPPR